MASDRGHAWFDVKPVPRMRCDYRATYYHYRKMIDSLQDKLQRQQESKHIGAFKARLAAFECYAVVEATEFPSTLTQAVRTASEIDTPRQSRVARERGYLIAFPGDDMRYLESVVGDVAAWAERMFVQSGVSVERFYLSTPFRSFPWIDCKVVEPGWVQNLSDVCGLNVSAISHDKTSFLAIDNGEHWLDAYWCGL